MFARVRYVFSLMFIAMLQYTFSSFSLEFRKEERECVLLSLITCVMYKTNRIQNMMVAWVILQRLR